MKDLNKHHIKIAKAVEKIENMRKGYDEHIEVLTDMWTNGRLASREMHNHVYDLSKEMLEKIKDVLSRVDGVLNKDETDEDKI